MIKAIKVRCLTVKEIRERFSQSKIKEYSSNHCEIETIEHYHNAKPKNFFFVKEFNLESNKYEKYYNICINENDTIFMPFTNWIPKDYVVPFSREIKIFEDN